MTSPAFWIWGPRGTLEGDLGSDRPLWGHCIKQLCACVHAYMGLQRPYFPVPLHLILLQECLRSQAGQQSVFSAMPGGKHLKTVLLKDSVAQSILYISLLGAG